VSVGVGSGVAVAVGGIGWNGVGEFFNTGGRFAGASGWQPAGIVRMQQAITINKEKLVFFISTCIETNHAVFLFCFLLHQRT